MIHSKWLLAILLVHILFFNFNISIAAETNSDNAVEEISLNYIPKETVGYTPYEVTQLQRDEWLHNFVTYSSFSILLYSLLLCLLITFLIIRQNVSWDPMSVIRFFGLTFIVTTGMYLIVSGYSDQQIAGMMGLLGSLAGYLLGESKNLK